MHTSQKTVMVVDDEAPVLRCLRRELARAGYTVLMAQSGPEALAMLESTHVDTLVTDHRMPGMLGSELVAEAVKVQPRLRRIIVTGSPEEVCPLAARDVLIMAKPWPPGALARLVSSELGETPLSDCMFGALPLPTHRYGAVAVA